MSRAVQRARIILKRFHDPGSKVVDVEGFLKAEGVQVVRWPLDDAISGVLLREPKPVIAVNAAHHINRQRFTMAHEYYHYLYHRSLDKLMCMTNLDDTRRYEREANQFAAALLMPEHIVRGLLHRYDFETVAERMMVSAEALQWRLRELAINYYHREGIE